MAGLAPAVAAAGTRPGQLPPAAAVVLFAALHILSAGSMGLPLDGAGEAHTPWEGSSWGNRQGPAGSGKGLGMGGQTCRVLRNLCMSCPRGSPTISPPRPGQPKQRKPAELLIKFESKLTSCADLLQEDFPHSPDRVHRTGLFIISMPAPTASAVTVLIHLFTCSWLASSLKCELIGTPRLRPLVCLSLSFECQARCLVHL